MPVRRHEPIFVPTRSSKYSTHHDYGIDDTINRADYLSNAVLQDTYEAAKNSRGKDHALLRNLNAAIAEAPWYLRARGGSVPPTDNRNVRAASVPPRPKRAQQFYKPPEPLPTETLRAHRPVALRSDILRAARARSLEPPRRPDYQVETPYQSFIPSTQLWAHRPNVLRKDAGLLSKAKARERQSYPGSLTTSASVPSNFDRASDYYFTIPDVQERALSRYLYAHRGRFGPESKPPRPSLGNFPQVYVPWRGSGPSNRSKAAIIGSRLDAADGGRSQRRPRSDYAANKLRELKREESERKYQ